MLTSPVFIDIAWVISPSLAVSIIWFEKSFTAFNVSLLPNLIPTSIPFGKNLPTSSRITLDGEFILNDDLNPDITLFAKLLICPLSQLPAPLIPFHKPWTICLPIPATLDGILWSPLIILFLKLLAAWSPLLANCDANDIALDIQLER